AKDNASWETDPDGNRFIRLRSPEPGKLVMLYRQLAIPAGAQALELTWRWRVTDLKVGKQPWFDARMIVELVDADGKKAPGQPSPVYSRGTKGWAAKSMRFLVPEGAVTLKLMPSLFQVASGTLDLDDIVLRSTDAAELEATARLREEEARLRHVPPE